ncbi:MAG: filamentous hemagglutinin N-terminal domain-containing protein [Candidatus Symbiobacter sp.]|nr:filamentous hemagglutinin N-terminal domain-containing protein [Candidatus Symbiobacter sp.]
MNGTPTRKNHRIKSALSLASLTMLLAGSAMAAAPPAPSVPMGFPAGGNVVKGTATLGAAANKTMVITQSTPRAVIEWNSFNLAAGNTLIYKVGAGNATLNRVIGSGNFSTIAGVIASDGAFYLTNPNGIVWKAGAAIFAQSYLLTSGAIGNSNFADNMGNKPASGDFVSAKLTATTDLKQTVVTEVQGPLQPGQSAVYIGMDLDASHNPIASTNNTLLNNVAVATVSLTPYFTGNPSLSLIVTDPGKAEIPATAARTVEVLYFEQTFTDEAGVSHTRIAATVNVDGMPETTSDPCNGRYPCTLQVNIPYQPAIPAVPGGVRLGLDFDPTILWTNTLKLQDLTGPNPDFIRDKNGEPMTYVSNYTGQQITGDTIKLNHSLIPNADSTGYTNPNTNITSGKASSITANKTLTIANSKFTDENGKQVSALGGNVIPAYNGLVNTRIGISTVYARNIVVDNSYLSQFSAMGLGGGAANSLLVQNNSTIDNTTQGPGLDGAVVAAKNVTIERSNVKGLNFGGVGDGTITVNNASVGINSTRGGVTLSGTSAIVTLESGFNGSFASINLDTASSLSLASGSNLAVTGFGSRANAKGLTVGSLNLAGNNTLTLGGELGNINLPTITAANGGTLAFSSDGGLTNNGTALDPNDGTSLVYNVMNSNAVLPIGIKITSDNSVIGTLNANYTRGATKPSSLPITSGVASGIGVEP